jgi:hypothetical protein
MWTAVMTDPKFKLRFEIFSEDGSTKHTLALTVLVLVVLTPVVVYILNVLPILTRAWRIFYG